MKTLSGRRASQKPDEIGGFIAAIKAEECRSYLEIGARHGDTFYEVVRTMPKDGLYLAVDLPGGAWGVESSAKSLKKAVEKLRAEGWKNVDYILGNSTAADVIEAIADHAPFDACLIDGDHRYEGVKADWDNYRPLVGKLVAFHDIDGEGVRKDDMVVEVPRLWREIVLSEAYFVQEFISDEEPERPMGIGIVYLETPHAY